MERECNPSVAREWSLLIHRRENRESKQIVFPVEIRLTWLLIGVDQLNTYATDFVRVHIVVLPRIRLSDIPPSSSLPHRKAKFFICGGSFG